MPKQIFGFDQRDVNRISSTVIRSEATPHNGYPFRARAQSTPVSNIWQVVEIDGDVVRAKRLNSDGTLDEEIVEFDRYTGED